MSTYWLSFGPDDPRSFTGLAPTFLIFQTETGTTLAPPGITERIAGTGFYQFSYSPSLSITFLVDGGATLQQSFRYIRGNVNTDQSLAPLIGDTGSSFGTDVIDPTTVFGFLKRLQEFLEGNAVFTKASGEWDIYSRGSSQQLATKFLTNSTTTANKT